jgi:hypothetical protein
VVFGTYSATSGADGSAEIMLPYGTHDYTVSATGYSRTEGTMTLTAEGEASLDVSLNVNRAFEVSALMTLKDEAGNALAGAEVTLDGETRISDQSGSVLFQKNVGSYELTINAEGYKPISETLVISSTDAMPDIVLEPAGADYDEATQVISIDDGYTGWTDKTGGTQIADGSILERGTSDRIVWVEGPSGDRIALKIPKLDGLWIVSVSTVKNSDNSKVSVTVGNYAAEDAETMTVIAALYDANGRFRGSAAADIASLAAGDQTSAELDLRRDITAFSVKIFLIDAESAAPLAPAKEY